VNNGGGNSTGCFEIKVGMNAAEFTKINSVLAEFSLMD